MSETPFTVNFGKRVFVVTILSLNPDLPGACYIAFVCVRVPVCKISPNNIEPINFIFGGSFPSDPGRKPFDFEKKKKKRKKERKKERKKVKKIAPK